MGTGHVSCVFVDSKEAFCIVVRSEVDGVCILKTLIQWTDPSGKDFALRRAYKRFRSGLPLIDTVFDLISEIDPVPSQSHQESENVDFKGTLPTAELANLPEIERILSLAYKSPVKFLTDFVGLLEVCEDLEATQDLYKLSNIAHDQEYPNTRGNHREYLSKHAQFKQIVPIENEEIVTKIKQVYRVNYLKDVALARVIPDNTFSTLHSVAYFNNSDIIAYFSQNGDFLDKLMAILSSQTTSMTEKKDVILFLYEMCTIAKTLQKSNQSQAIGEHGFFALFEHNLGNRDESVRTPLLAILSNLLEHDPTMVRAFCIAQVEQKQKPLLETMITQFLNEPDLGLMSQYADLIKIVLDTTGGLLAQPNKVENDVNRFLEIFYRDFSSLLFAPLSAQKDLDQRQEAVVNHLCGILSFSISQHALFCKNYLLQHDHLKDVALLLKSSKNYLKLSALRVFRSCVGLNDEFYRRLLLKQDIFGKILHLTIETEGKYNLLNSACLEFFEYIRKQMIVHIVTNHKNLFEKLEYCQVFKGLESRFEEYQDVEEQNQKDGWHKIDIQEEAYFNGSDEEEAIPKPEERDETKKRALVDYPDDEEDDFVVRKTVKPKMTIALKTDLTSLKPEPNSF
ncbi:component of IIS longevity pathway SMK-1-domain-containing protein [Gorgonomyces haynaldii]|nr:component of IIS longevity pathway SMK-1-domain-containing protein [Gorgonomyces haynaldii]